MGAQLLDQMAVLTEAEGYWMLQAQILAANKASRALFSRSGYREVGYRERLGHVNGAWHDVILMERRSEKAGGPGLPTYSCG